MNLSAKVSKILCIFASAIDRFPVNLRLNGATDIVITYSLHSQLLQLTVGSIIFQPEMGRSHAIFISR
ncbi:MAG: hypothetical protein ABI180_18905 [Microcoleus sp.]